MTIDLGPLKILLQRHRECSFIGDLEKGCQSSKQCYAPFVWLLGELWRVFHAARCAVFEMDALQVTEIGITAQIPLPQHRKT